MCKNNRQVVLKVNTIVPAVMLPSSARCLILKDDNYTTTTANELFFRDSVSHTN